MYQKAMLKVSILALCLLTAGSSSAAEPDIQTLTLEHHVFSPSTLTIPPNVDTRIRVANKDDTAEEFESSDLKIEKIVGGNRDITVRVPASAPGSYRFIGEFHQETANGTIEVK